MKRFLDQGVPQQTDVLVVGGGITGASVAYECARAGLQVVLVEKQDFGWATSAATSKLIHGGLRYLRTMEFGLVRESLRERRILEDIAPNLVHPLTFVMPHYSRKEQWMLSAGLALYDLLAFDRGRTKQKEKRIPSHRRLSRAEVLERAEVVRPVGMVGGSLYYDCQSIFPERLTLAFVKSAEAHGALVANHVETTDFVRDGKEIRGARVRDTIRNTEHTIQARVVVNSGGPWADRLLNLATDVKGPGRLRMSEGIHIIVPRLVENDALVLLTPSGRHFFILPWRNHSLIGTTDKPYEGDPGEYRVSKRSIEEFLAEINGALGRELIRYRDIVFAYGGLRPLTDTQTESTYSSSRRYEIFDGSDVGADGLLTVEGGKYTTSRNLGQTVMSRISKKLGRALPDQSSADVPLFGCDVPDINDFIVELGRLHPELGMESLRYLARNYGTEAHEVLALAEKDEKLFERLTPDGEIAAEIVYAVRSEMALTLEDVLLRRTGFGTLGLPADHVLNRTLELTARELGWDESRQRDERARLVDRLRVP